MKLLRSRRLVFAALLAFALAGCSSNARLGGVTETLVTFHPTGASLAENRGTITVRYTNENISPLGFSGSTHKLYLNGTYIGKAVSKQPFGIPPTSAATQDATIEIADPAFVRQLLATAGSKTAAYRMESVLFQTIYEDNYEYKISSKGAVDLRGAGAAAK